MARIDSMIVGAEKAGTSELAARLESHCRVIGHTQKVLEYPGFVPEANSSASEKEPQIELFARDQKKAGRFLAKQVDMMYRAESLRLLHDHNSECRIICALRNPVDRAYSSYWYQRYRGAEICGSFEEAVDREIENGMMAEKLDTAYLLKSRYDFAIRTILDYFPYSQVKVIVFEEYVHEPTRVLSDVFDFLGLEVPGEIAAGDSNSARMVRSEWLAVRLFSDNVLKRTLRNVLPGGARRKLYHGLRRVNSAKRRPPAMSAETRARLEEYFAPSVESLESLLDRDVKHWWGGA